MTTWRLTRIRSGGPRDFVRVFTDLDTGWKGYLGELRLTPAEFDDLAVRLASDALDRILRLTGYLLEHFDDERPIPDAVDKAIELLERYRVVESERDALAADLLPNYQRGWRDGANWRNKVHAEAAKNPHHPDNHVFDGPAVAPLAKGTSSVFDKAEEDPPNPIERPPGRPVTIVVTNRQPTEPAIDMVLNRPCTVYVPPEDCSDPYHCRVHRGAYPAPAPTRSGEEER